MTKKALLLILTAISLTLSACSALNPISALTPKPTFDITSQMGAENNQNKSLVDLRQVSEVDQSGAQRANSSQAPSVQSADWSAQTIMVHQNNEQPIGFLYLLLLIAGWILPDPISLLRSLKCKLLRWKRRKRSEEP